MGDRLQHLHLRDAFLLLCHSIAMPRLLYILRSSPCFLSPALPEYDSVLRSVTSSLININLQDDDRLVPGLPSSQSGWFRYSECRSAGTVCLFGFCCCLIQPCQPDSSLSTPHHPLLTLGVHAQRGLRYLVRVCVCLSAPFRPLRVKVSPDYDTNASLRQDKENKTGDFLKNAPFKSYGVIYSLCRHLAVL